MAAAAAAVGLASAGSNLVSSLSTAGIQAFASEKLQSNEQTYNLGIMSHIEDTYANAGLPKYLAYSGGQQKDSLPGQQFQVRGGAYYSAGLVGQNLPVFPSQYSQYEHQGRPGDTGRMYANVPPWNEVGEENNMQNLNRGQNDRLGLGNGRYFVRGQTQYPLGYTAVNNPTGNRQVAAHQQAARIFQ